MKQLLFVCVSLAVIACPTHAAPAKKSVTQVARQLASENLPYKYGATDPKQGGLDCSGFVRWVFNKSHGIELPDEAGLQLEYFRKHGRVWDAKSGWTPADLRPGDLIFWTGTYPVRRKSPVTHVMIYHGQGVMSGAQSIGSRINARGPGVGLYRFHPTQPQAGSMPDSQFFCQKMRLYAYGRLPEIRPAMALTRGRRSFK